MRCIYLTADLVPLVQDDNINKNFGAKYQKMVLDFNAECAEAQRKGNYKEMAEKDWRDKHVGFLAQVK